MSSSSDPEKGAAIDLACDIADHLSLEGWPDGVWVDSGNGGHLLYRIDLPADDLSKQLLKAALKALAERFDNPAARVDRAMHNAARISKLPGTWARKGVEPPDRPHRMARLVRVPASLEIVSIDLLKALGGQPVIPPVNGQVNGAAHSPWMTRAGNRSLDGYVRSAIDRECDRVAMTPPGGRNDALNTSAFNLGTLAQWPEMLGIPARDELLRAALQAGLGDLESRKTIESGWTAGAGKGRQRPVDPHRNGTTPIQGKKQPPGPLKGSPILWAKDVVPRRVEWLWERSGIPRSKLTTFAGMGGLGKTFILCDIAARISNGDEWPFSGGQCAERGKVLFISGEDDPDDTLVPRLMEFGADLSRIAFLSTEALDRFSLGDIDAMDEVADLIGSELVLSIIDPPTAYLDGVDDHSNSELRSLLTPLKGWVKKRSCGLIFNTHVNKSSGARSRR